MKDGNNECGCGCDSNESKPQNMVSTFNTILQAPPEVTKPDLSEDVACCGPPAGPEASPFETAGYRIEPFINDFISTQAGSVPVVTTQTTFRDSVQTLLIRLNIGRNDYKIAPGLYCIGKPVENDHVLVTANYKLSFDYLRKELSGLNAWILVLDTRGINVWCAAGKGTFGTEELVNRIRKTGIEKVISHKKLIVPQLGAVGISGRAVKKQSGFSVIWGPVHTKDIKQFISNNMKAEPKMRQITFTLAERVALIPVEVSLTFKPALIAIVAVLFLSLFSKTGTAFISVSEFWSQGLPAVLTLFSGIIAGTVLTPVFLKQLPGTEFSLKGVVAGIALAVPTALLTTHGIGFFGSMALVMAAVSISSYLAMNFTGTTPFTSPSGVEKEMRQSIPVQAGALILSAVIWIYATL